jgi:hypothetical protein
VIDAPEVSVHNLERLAYEVRNEYFPDADGIPVIWGRNTGRKRRRSIRLGSYHRGERLIRIHPLLNSRTVPVYFIQSIIYHELLHDVLGPAHDRRFHRHERRFRFHRESKEWLAHNLPMLLGLRAKPKHVERRRLKSKEAPQPVQLNLF